MVHTPRTYTFVVRRQLFIVCIKSVFEKPSGLLLSGNRCPHDLNGVHTLPPPRRLSMQYDIHRPCYLARDLSIGIGLQSGDFWKTRMFDATSHILHAIQDARTRLHFAIGSVHEPIIRGHLCADICLLAICFLPFPGDNAGTVRSFGNTRD